jgi:prephenate dehydrogenase
MPSSKVPVTPNPMAARPYQRIAVIGVGLIGGSIAHGLRGTGLCKSVVGFDTNAAHVQTALERGLVDQMAPNMEDAIREADLVILAVAVGRTAELLPGLLAHLEPHAVLVDTGSVKQTFAKQCQDLIPPEVARRVVPCHPIAGHFASGPQHADAALMQGRVMIMTPVAETCPDVQTQVQALWEAVGFKVSCMSVQEHDAIYADLSHMPHVASFALMDHLAACQYDTSTLLGFGGNTIREMTRGAASSSRMWSDIFLANRTDVLRSLAGFRQRLDHLEACIANGDETALERYLAQVNAARPADWDVLQKR